MAKTLRGALRRRIAEFAPRDYMGQYYTWMQLQLTSELLSIWRIMYKSRESLDAEASGMVHCWADLGSEWCTRIYRHQHQTCNLP